MTPTSDKTAAEANLFSSSRCVQHAESPLLLLGLLLGALNGRFQQLLPGFVTTKRKLISYGKML